MFKKGSLLYGILKFKCPRCHEGSFFVDNNPYHLKKMSKMHEKCSKCNLRYELEPNFFHGSMYVSYGITVGLSIFTFVLFYLLGFGFLTTAIAMLTVLLLLIPVTFKLSRIIYINFFESYDKNILIKKD